MRPKRALALLPTLLAVLAAPAVWGQRPDASPAWHDANAAQTTLSKRCSDIGDLPTRQRRATLAMFARLADFGLRPRGCHRGSTSRLASAILLVSAASPIALLLR